MKKDLIDTIMEKDFHALSDAERKELASFCSSEDEYNQMKDVFIGVEQMTVEQPQPKAETKQRLDELFDATYPKAAPIWYSSVLTVVTPKGKPIYRQPLAQIAAIALLALLLVPFWNTDSAVIETPQQVAQDKPSDADVRSGGGVVETPVADVVEEDPVEGEASEVVSASEPVLVASVNPVVADPDAESMFGVASSAPGAGHPDGVFVAVSQPASETPEMFDLLTATF